jgi:hypothetical protein
MVQATKVSTIEIEVNTRPVTFPDERGRDEVSGSEIKAAAIAQGVAIRLDFPLFQVKNKKLVLVEDNERVRIRNGMQFRAVAPDDNS